MSEDMEFKMQQVMEQGEALKDEYDRWIDVTDVSEMLRSAAAELAKYINRFNKGQNPSAWTDQQTCQELIFAAHYVSELESTK